MQSVRNEYIPTPFAAAASHRQKSFRLAPCEHCGRFVDDQNLYFSPIDLACDLETVLATGISETSVSGLMFTPRSFKDLATRSVMAALSRVRRRSPKIFTRKT
jgi:hypothetical protein